MEQEFRKGSKEQQMFLDLWNICQKYWIPEDNDSYWHEVISVTDGFVQKYKDVHPAVRFMTLGFISGLEDIVWELRDGKEAKGTICLDEGNK